MRVLRTTLVLVALSLAPLAVGTAQPLSPLTVDWEQYFTVQQWPLPGRAVATVWNRSGWNVGRIQMLVEALDDRGQPTAQRVVWLGSDLAAGTRANVDTPMPSAPAYRVRVFAFDLDLAAGPR